MTRRNYPCPSCGTERLLVKQPPKSRMCQTCSARSRAEKARAIVLSNGNLTELTCAVCKEIKQLDAFAMDKSNKTHGRQGTCRECRKISWQNMPPSRNRWRKIYIKYGITEQQWLDMWDAQGHVCGCCGTDNPNSTLGWHTDHCHTTGRFRGILCMNCNRGLGYFSREGLSRALHYLQDGE